MASVVALALAGCGTRLPQSAIVGAARVVVSGAAGVSDGGGTGTGTDTGGTVAGGVPTVGASGGTATGSTTTGGTTTGGTTTGGTTTGGGSTTGSKTGGTSGSSGGGSTSGPATGSVVTLGNIGTYSGVLGPLFAGLQTALQVWTQYANAHGGLNGHVVKVISQDDGGDPSTALSIAQTMVQQDHIIAFLDPFLIFDYAPISQYAKSVNIPVIGGDGLNAGWETDPIMFSQTASTPAQSSAVAKFFSSGGQSKLGVVYCIEVPSLCGPIADTFKAAASQQNLTMAYSASASLTAPSFTSNCINAQQAGVQGLWLILDGNSATRFARDCAAQGYHPKYALLSLDATPVVTQDSNFVGSIVPGSVFPSAYNGNAASQAYHQAMQQYAPSLVPNLDGATAQAWAAGILAMTASKYLSASNPTAAQFLQGLWSIKNNTLGGLTIPLTFNQGSHRTVGNCAFIVGIANGSFTAPNGITPVC